MTSEPEELESRSNTRRTLVRMAVSYLPLGVATTGLLLFSLSALFSGSFGALIPSIFIGIFAFAFIVEGMSAFRDLRSAGPITAVGAVRRTWSRGGLLWFFRSHYMYVGDNVYTVAPLTAVSVRTGDRVEVEHWPHTKTVVRVRLLEPGSGYEAPERNIGGRPKYR